jgi:hypothetical protein
MPLIQYSTQHGNADRPGRTARPGEAEAPVRHDRSQRHVVFDAEEQVDVRPSVLAAVRGGAGHRSSRDAGVRLGELEQVLAHRLPWLTGEHGAT